MPRLPSRPFDRRDFLCAATGAVAAFAASALARERAPQIDDPSSRFVRRSATLGGRAIRDDERLEPAFGANPFSCLVVGDTGWPNDIVATNAAAMAREHASRPARCALLLGDNFYRDGVRSIDDPRWNDLDRVFDPRALPIPFHAILGNHDHKGDVQAQVERTAIDARWRMPGRWHSFHYDVGNGHDVEFFVVDTTPIDRGEDMGEQARWLERELARSDAHWKIVCGHHPIVGHGEHGGSKAVARALAGALTAHDVDLYLSGHDHDLELVRTDARWLQVACGAGSNTRDVTWSDETLFASGEAGFARLSIAGDVLALEFFDSEGTRVFTHVLSKSA